MDAQKLPHGPLHAANGRRRFGGNESQRMQDSHELMLRLMGKLLDFERGGQSFKN